MAREDIIAFKSSLELSHSKPSLDLSVNVLSASAWPSYPDVPLHIPRFIENAIRGFENYYHSKHSGRKLTWKHPLAHCQLKACFPKGNKEIVVSSFQAVILLLLNDYSPNHEVPYTEIQAVTNLRMSTPKLPKMDQLLLMPYSGRRAATNTAVTCVREIPSFNKDPERQGCQSY